MNAVSGIQQRYDLTPPRRNISVTPAAGFSAKNADIQQQNTPQSQQPLQGELLDKNHPLTTMRISGVTLEGQLYRAHDAVNSYRLHQALTMESIQNPGELLDTKV